LLSPEKEKGLEEELQRKKPSKMRFHKESEGKVSIRRCVGLTKGGSGITEEKVRARGTKHEKPVVQRSRVGGLSVKSKNPAGGRVFSRGNIVQDEWFSDLRETKVIKRYIRSTCERRGGLKHIRPIIASQIGDIAVVYLYILEC